MDAKWILVDEAVGNDFTKTVCEMCIADLSVPFYTRDAEDGTRNVHKACLDLPKEIQHKLHPGHTLIPLDELGDYQQCSCCDDYGYSYYKCSQCDDFVLPLNCALKSFPITHTCHPHPLIPIHGYRQPIHCVVCRSKRFTATYDCTACPFEVHQVCVSSRIVKLPLHCHDVKFIHSLPAENQLTDQLNYCHTCEQDMEEGDFAYHCARCRYIFHTYSCRPMVHFCHPDHPLNLVNEGADVDSASKKCYICDTNISAPYYYCNDKNYKECRSFFLHKYCAELPQNVQHPLHPSHALTLSGDDNSSKCNACHVPCQGLSYSCAFSSCRFTIDTICAMKTLHKHEFHQHPLFSSPTKASLACRACNLDSEGPTYQCTTCRFWVHHHCASLPTFKKNYLHPHKLQLTYSLQDSFPEYTKHFQHFHCHVCREDIRPHNWAYHCFRCKYFTHAHNCSDPDRDTEEFDSEAALAAAVHLPVPNESVTLTKLFFMDINQGEDEELEIKTRKTLFLDPNKTCDVCEGFLAAPCNSCALCKYFLLKSPSELKDPSLFQGLYSMLKDTSENICNGFGMSCLEDRPIIKISSSVLPRYVKHEGHNHILTTTFIVEPSWCNACENDFQGYGFRCNFCNFTIDTYCALLPGSISHGSDKEHGFKLTYYSIEDVEEYVCEICEEDITTMWFYHCEECDHSIHPRCIWKIHIKFGPFISNGSSEEGCPLIPSTNIECYTCRQEESSGCCYSYVNEKVRHGDENHLLSVHLQCNLNGILLRWPKEQEELLRILDTFRSQAD